MTVKITVKKYGQNYGKNTVKIMVPKKLFFKGGRGCNPQKPFFKGVHKKNFLVLGPQKTFLGGGPLPKKFWGGGPQKTFF